MDSYQIDVDDLWPRDAEHRYRLYGRRGGELHVLAAAADPGGIGAAIVQLHEDAKAVGGTLGDQGVTGVLDAVAREWVVVPWERGRGLTAATVMLAQPDRRRVQ